MDILTKRDLTVRGIELGIATNSLWKENRYYYDSETVMYFCRSTIHKASTSTGDHWHIWKTTYNVAGDVIRVEGPLIGNADVRASLGWVE